MNLLFNLDEQLFKLINSHSNIYFDYLFSTISYLGEYGIIWIIISIICLLYDDKNGKTVFMLLMLAILFSFLLNDVLIKNVFFRERPYLALENIHQLGISWTNSSFLSSHASLSVSSAIILIYFYPKAKYLIYFFVFFMLYSRIYLGMHYPLDVIGGFLVGLITGFVLVYLYQTTKFKNFILRFTK